MTKIFKKNRIISIIKVTAIIYFSAVLFPVFGFEGKNDKLITITYKSEEAKNLFDKGMKLFCQILENESYEYFEKAADIDSTFALAYAFKGRVHPTFEGKKENISKAVSLSEKASEGERILITALHAFYVNNEPDKEFTFYKLLAEKFPEDPLARYFWGYSNWRHGRTNYEAAEQELKKAIELDSTLPAAYNDLGYVLVELKKYDEALLVLSRYTELSPNNVNAFDTYAEAQLKMGLYEESINSYKKALEIDSNYFWSNLGISVNLRYLNRLEESKTIINTLPAKAKNQRELNHAKTAKIIADMYEENWGETIKEISKQYDEAVVKKDVSRIYTLLTYWGDVLRELKQADDAVEKYIEAEKTIRNSTAPASTKKRINDQLSYKIIKTNFECDKINEAVEKLKEFEKFIADSSRNDLNIFLSELKALSAFKEKRYIKAIDEISNADGSVSSLYTKALILSSAGYPAESKKILNELINKNELNDFDYSLIRKKSKILLVSLSE